MVTHAKSIELQGDIGSPPRALQLAAILQESREAVVDGKLSNITSLA